MVLWCQKNIIKKIFILNHNDNSINVTNNNNYGNNKAVYDVQHYIMCVSEKHSKIYDDDILNELMIKTLNESDDVIASAIEYIYKDKICFVDKMWYYFNGIIWKECDINNNVIAKFVALYEQIKQFITKATDIFEVVKHEYREQLNDIIYNIKNMKKNKHIIAILEDKFLTKNSFDLNMNIFAFDNGVYDFEKMKFRQTISTDMVMSTCGYNYCDKYVNKKGLINIMQNIFPNNTMDFFLAYIASSLCGKNNFNFLLILKIKNLRHKMELITLLISSFGNVIRRTDKLSHIIFPNVKYADLLGLERARLVISDSSDHISDNEITQLIDQKLINYIKIKSKIESINVFFSTLCMCESDPIIDDNVKDNVVTIEILDNSYEKNNINKNDFFLLLLEYLKKIRKSEITMGLKYMNECNMTSGQKICYNFINECIEINNDNNKKVKSADVYARYIVWANENNIDNKMSRIKLNNELKKYVRYSRSTQMTINGHKKYFPAFFGISLKTW